MSLDEEIVEAAAVLSQDSAIAAVVPREELFEQGLGRYRSGERSFASFGTEMPARTISAALKTVEYRLSASEKKK